MIERSVINKDEAQALANFLWNEKERHLGDVIDIDIDLDRLRVIWGVSPRQEREFVKP